METQNWLTDTTSTHNRPSSLVRVKRALDSCCLVLQTEQLFELAAYSARICFESRSSYSTIILQRHVQCRFGFVFFFLHNCPFVSHLSFACFSCDAILCAIRYHVGNICSRSSCSSFSLQYIWRSTNKEVCVFVPSSWPFRTVMAGYKREVMWLLWFVRRGRGRLHQLIWLTKFINSTD